MEFPRQEYWNGLPFLSPGNLPHPGIEPASPALQADSLLLSHRGSPEGSQQLLLSRLSHVRLLETPWTIIHQGPLSMRFSRKEYWSGLPFPSPEDLPNPEIKPMSLTSPVLAGRFFISSASWEVHGILQFSSVAQSCLTLCNPMNRSTPGLPVHHQLLEFTQTHVHQVGDAIQPSHPLSSPSTPAPNTSQHQGLFQ